jgi:hypothetical protein
MRRLARHQWLTPVMLAIWKAEIRRIMARSQLRQVFLETLSQKHLTQNKAGRVAQVVEHLPSGCEVLSSNPSTTGGGGED